jgi:hypothetical protein
MRTTATIRELSFSFCWDLSETEIITCATGGIYPDRAAKQQTPVTQVIISITGGIYPDRAARQQTPVMRVIISSFLNG